MENLPLPPFSATISNTSSSSVSDNSPSTESRLLENTNWYDEGSIETCIHESTLPQVSSIELREIANEEILHEVDVNGIGDEFFLFSPHNTTDDEPSSSLSDDKHEQELIQIESPIQTSKNLYKMNEKNSNLSDDDDLRLSEEFQNLKDLNSFGFNNSNNNNSSLMITDLDDLLNEDDDDDHLKDSPNYLSNSNYRRPIQEDILYEVEHENSYSDHSQNTSSIITADDKASIKADPNLDFLTSTKEPMENDIHHHSSFIETSLQDRQSKPNELTSSLKQTINDNSTLPIYILPPVDTTTKETSSSLHIDTYNNPFSDQWNSYERRYPDLTSPSYTPKIRHRHFSVGSYYDNKTTTVAIHPNHTFFILGSAPVSPLARSSTANHDSHYYVQHHSPISYETIAYNALRHINPFLDTDPYLSPYGYQRPSPSLNKDDSYQTVTSYSEQQTMPIIQTEPTSVVSTRVVTFPEGEEEKEKEKEEEIPNILPKMASTSSPLASSSSSSSSSPPPHQFAQVPPLVRPKTSRGRPRTPPPPPPPRTISLENDDSQNIYHEIDSTSTDDDQTTAPNDDLKFIRGTIERVFDFNGETASEIKNDDSQNIYHEIDSTSTDDDQTTAPNDDLKFIRGTIERVFDFNGETASEISTNRDEISEDIKNDDDDDESISLSNGTKTVSKKANQYPAVEAVQRFYQNKTPSDSEKNKPNKQPVDIDVTPISHHSSTSNKLYARSHPRNARKKESSPSKSTDTEQVTSEEVDDTLNDIEDDDYQDDKMKRQATNNSSRTSNETSPVHSSDNQIKVKKTSQETQTLQRQKPIILTTQSPSGSQSTIQSYETACSNIPPLDIVTQMVIERTDGIDDGQIGEITGDMIIYYDDIEIVEHPSNLSSTESESTSTYSKPIKNAKPVRTIIETTAPPPIPARTLKPVHLLSNNHHHHHHHHQQSPSPLQNEPVTSSTTKINRIYELEKSTIRKKFDVNTVNNMLNRTEHNVGSNGTHRLPSARHFVGKINSDDTSSHNSSISSPKILTKPLPTSTMVKSQTLPLQPTTTNGHSRTNILHSPTKSPYSTLPVRSSSSVGTNNNRHQSVIADTNALVKQIQNSLSRNSLHDIHNTAPLSISTKDLRTFVSSTYSPSDENMIDDDGVIHVQHQKSSYHDEQAFKRQARLSKSFHNVSEYNSSDQYPKKENHFTSRTQPSKSVENNLNQVTQKPIRNTQMLLNFPPIVASTSFAALPHSEDNARMLSMKWYTGQVSENSEICYNTSHMDNDDLLYGYITRHSNPESQLLLARLQASNDIRIHAALDDIRLRVAQFDASKSPDDLHIFIRYLESRLRDISNKNSGSLPATLNRNEGQKRITNGGTTNGYHTQKQQPDVGSIKSRTSSIVTGTSKETSPLQRQVGRQHLRSSGNIATVGGETNGHPTSRPPPPPRRSSQTSINQENPAVFDDMLNTVLGLPKKGVRSQTPTNSSSFQNRDKSTPLTQTQMPTNNTSTGNKTGRDVGKRLFESGTYKDPRLIYDGSQKNEKEEEPLETSV
ncbi:unnamed protein product [Adineta steineri]|uniref:Uncharacterized protein n=1 Tax=Adineta steineri TaxID=433720 RepID=A0A815GGJ1_9BILA|nr:unnamed protein product [Adineta steineri]